MKYILVVLLVHQAICNKGPIGWDSYRHLDRMPKLHNHVRTRMISSFDRTGGNDDGQKFGCLRMTSDNRCLLAEWIGAGEIDSIWNTRDNGVFNKTGKITVILDDVTVIDHNLEVILQIS